VVTCPRCNGKLAQPMGKLVEPSDSWLPDHTVGRLYGCWTCKLLWASVNGAAMPARAWTGRPGIEGSGDGADRERDGAGHPQQFSPLNGLAPDELAARRAKLDQAANNRISDPDANW
jgi:hypothetical protein